MSSTDGKVKVGVMGVGSLGQWHARIYSELETAELVGVYDVDHARATEIAEKYGTRAFSDMDEMASLIDATSVVVPTDRHFEIFSRLADHGLHMLVEKPIATSLEEAEKMVAIAEAKELLLQVGHVERFNPVMQFLEDNLSHPRFVEAIRMAPYPPPRDGAPPRGTEVSVVLDLMIHDLDIILHLVRSPVRDVHAVGIPVLSPTEDIANVRLSFENQCVANVTASRISHDRMRKIRVFQEDTYVSLDYMNQEGVLRRKANGVIESEQVPINKAEPLAEELASFIQCVQTRRDPVVSGEHGSQALELALEICRTIRSNPS
jgi:predicted dehydrogenase